MHHRRDWACDEMIKPPYSKAALLAACCLLASAQVQSRLFSSNQNSYFLVGLARAGYGCLSNDWMATRTDHVPVFSWLVSTVHTYGGHWMFYVLFCAMVALYLVSLSAIVAYQNGPSWHSALQAPLFISLMALVHCSWVLKPLGRLMPCLYTTVSSFHHFAMLLTDGL